MDSELIQYLNPLGSGPSGKICPRCARNLHKTAQIVASDYNSEFPESVDGLLKLPGIGRYTAGAIASIAFGVSAPVLDGNVIRVFTRILDMDDDVTQTSTKNKLWEIADEGNGEYISGANTTEAVAAISQLLQEMDKMEFEAKQFAEFKDQFQWFLGGALLLLLLDIFVLERKTAWLRKLDLFNEKKAA